MIDDVIFRIATFFFKLSMFLLDRTKKYGNKYFEVKSEYTLASGIIRGEVNEKAVGVVAYHRKQRKRGL